MKAVIELQQSGGANHPTILSRMSENGPMKMLEKWVDHCKKCTPIEVCNFKKAPIPNPGMPCIQKSVNRYYVMNTPCTRQRLQLFDLYDKKILSFVCAVDTWHAHDLCKGKLNLCPVQGKYGIHIRFVILTAQTIILVQKIFL